MGKAPLREYNWSVGCSKPQAKPFLMGICGQLDAAHSLQSYLCRVRSAMRHSSSVTARLHTDLIPSQAWDMSSREKNANLFPFVYYVAALGRLVYRHILECDDYACIKKCTKF